MVLHVMDHVKVDALVLVPVVVHPVLVLAKDLAKMDVRIPVIHHVLDHVHLAVQVVETAVDVVPDA